MQVPGENEDITYLASFSYLVHHFVNQLGSRKNS
jgi:hypothetical protein